MTVAELIEKLKLTPQELLVSIPVPEYWEGDTLHESVEKVEVREVTVGYLCTCNHHHEKHNQPNPETGAPSKRCGDCNCTEFVERPVREKAVVIE